jgi:hypothetical protein
MKNRKIDWLNATVWIGMVVFGILFWYGVYRLLF